MDQGNFYHDYLGYMNGLSEIKNISALVTAVFKKKSNQIFVIPYDAVFSDDPEGLSLARLLVGSYNPFVRVGAYSEQDVISGINAFLSLNGRPMRLKELSDVDVGSYNVSATVVGMNKTIGRLKRFCYRLRGWGK